MIKESRIVSDLTLLLCTKVFVSLWGGGGEKEKGISSTCAMLRQMVAENQGKVQSWIWKPLMSYQHWQPLLRTITKRGEKAHRTEA